MRWCLDHLDAVRAARAAGTLGIGPLSSFLTLRLCRDRPWLADPCNATRTQLWSLVERDWSPSLPGRFGVPRDILPRTVPNRGPFGMLTTRGHPLPLVAVTGDQSAVPFACGVPDPDTLYVNIGTGAFLQRLCDGAQAPVAGLLRSVLWQEDNVLRFSDEGTVNGAGAALQAEADHAGLSVDAMQAQLETWLAQTGDPPLFLNGVAGLGSPWWVADFPSRHVGSGDTPARCVAIVESIAFLVQRNFDAWREAGVVPRDLTLTGGLAHLDGLCRRIAALSGLDVLRPDLAEATARGLAFLVAGAPPHWTRPAVRRFDAQPDLHLRSRYERWRQLMEAEVRSLRAR